MTFTQFEEKIQGISFLNSLFPKSTNRSKNSNKPNLFRILGKKKDQHMLVFWCRAGNGGRTRDFNLGKVALYHWVIPAHLM